MLSKKFNPLRTSCQDADPPTPTFFVYASPPQPVWGRPIYRNNVPRPRGVHDYYNVMWDPHVRRGDAVKRDEEKKQMRKCLNEAPKKKRKQKQFIQHEVKRGETPPALEGRKHFDSQTETYLESLEAEVVEFAVTTQTEAVHEMPAVPWFVPSKIGQDEGTQIEPGDLFDFDLEVKPLVETLIGKVVEQALLEVMEEEELMSLKDQHQAFEERLRIEQLRLERLREREQRVNAEKERLMQEQRRYMMEEQETEDLISAKAFASLYLTRASRHAIDSLEQDGFLNAKSIIANAFIPWLNCGVEHVLATENVSRDLLNEIIQSVVDKRQLEYGGGVYTAATLGQMPLYGDLYPEDE